MSTSSDAVTAALAAAGLTSEIRTLESTAKTAALAAAQLGVEVGAIANSLVFEAEGEPLLIMTSGAHRVDTDLVARELGMTRIGRADPDFVRAHTGQAIGGVAPVGHPAKIRTVVDVALAAFPQLWAAGGHPHSVFSLSYDELVRITSGVELTVSGGTTP